MSFSNERMREIDRHNQILLRKILTQKPTYNLKSKPSQSTVQKVNFTTQTKIFTFVVAGDANVYNRLNIMWTLSLFNLLQKLA